MAVEAGSSKQVEHIAHEERVEDGRGKLDVAKVTRTLERVHVACRADVMWTHRPECGIVETSCIWVVGGVEEDRVDDLLD